jgi:hypothetical protein
LLCWKMKRLRENGFCDVAMTSGATDIRNWIRNIEQHASDNVNKILVGNKADMDESKRVSTGHLVWYLTSYLSLVLE